MKDIIIKTINVVATRVFSPSLDRIFTNLSTDSDYSVSKLKVQYIKLRKHIVTSTSMQVRPQAMVSNDMVVQKELI